MAKKLVSINTLKKRIKTTLEKQGSYNEGLDISIETTAITLQSLYSISDARQENPNPVLIEKSREGHDKTVPNPIYKMQSEQLEIIRKQLRELRLTLATGEGMGDDDFNNLIDEVNSI